VGTASLDPDDPNSSRCDANKASQFEGH